MADGETDGTLSSLASVGRGAVLFAGSQLFSNVAGFLLHLLLAQSLGAATYGVYAYANTLVSLFTRIADLGADNGLLRFLPVTEDDEERQGRVLGVAYAVALIGSLVAVVVLVVGAPLLSQFTLDTSSFTTVLSVFALVLPMDVLVRVIASTFRGFEAPGRQLFLQKGLRPLGRLCGAAVAVAVGLSTPGIVASLAVSTLLVVLIGVVLLVRAGVRPSLTASRAEAYEFLDYSVPLSVSRVGALLYRRVDILMVGYFLTSTAVGVYNVAVLLTRFVTLPVTGINQVFPSIAARLYENDEYEKLQTVYAVTTRWSYTAAAFIAMVEIIYRRELLALFGEGFDVGAVVLVLFAGGQLVNASVGPTNYVLMMTDHQYLVLVNQWTLGLVNVALNVYFISVFGLVGAALATAGVIGLQNVVQLAELWYLERLNPYSAVFLKPTAAVSVVGVVMYALRTVLDGPVVLVGGGLLGGFVLLVLLAAFGIEDADRELLAQILDRY